MAIREHCWHYQDSVILTHPAIFTELCCHCGQTRKSVYKPDPVKHGKYHPGECNLIPAGWSEPENPCVEREE